jgi:penicillin amidase
VGQAARRPLRAPDRAAVDAALARRLAAGPVPVGGGGETVGDTGYASDEPPKGVEDTRAFFKVASGASFRQVIDVGAWDRSLTMNNPGQSGDPSSPHYRDLIERSAKGRPVPLLFSRERVEAAAELRISCTPP